MRIAIIGCGNMGRTFVECFSKSHSVSPNDLLILDHSPERCEGLKREGFRHVHNQPGEYLERAELIILAVKPQDVNELFAEIGKYVHDEQVVLSIMAGRTVESISQGLGVSKVIRAMPNLPCQVGMGMTAFTASDAVGRRELIEVQNLINTTGKSMYFDDESQLDAVTALSGSGPAYVFYCMQALIKAGKEMGFTDAEAELLVQQTFVGSVHLKLKNELSPQEWISKVTSRGGTTEAAVKAFEKTNLTQGLIEGVKQAMNRSKELGS